MSTPAVGESSKSRQCTYGRSQLHNSKTRVRAPKNRIKKIFKPTEDGWGSGSGSGSGSSSSSSSRSSSSSSSSSSRIRRPREEDGRSRGLGECTSLGAPS